MADRVTFTKAAAERIASVVRTVEAGNRDTEGFPTAPRFGAGGNGAPVKFCSWSATWSYSSTATITFATGGATATANNAFLGVGPGDGWAARKGTAGWQLIGCDLTKQPGYAGGEIQLFGHDSSAVASWYSITTCATATA